jgi:ubiquinone/menaquinone biosynthesis C-methylase UbiE
LISTDAATVQAMAHTHGHDDDDDTLVEMLDLDAEVLHQFWSDVLGEVRRTIEEPTVIVDLGAGTGTGTVNLVRTFPRATVTAIDASEQMLHRIRHKAAALGLTGRVRTVQADLDTAWPVDGPVDLTWASKSLHHLADPDRLLPQVLASTRPGGVFAVIELTDPLRFLPDDLGLGRPGLEQRCLDVLRDEQAAALPHLGSDWPGRMAAAGFTLLGQHELAIDVTPQGPAALRYAQLWLQRLRSGVADRLAPDDADILSRLLDPSAPETLTNRGDLHIRGTRTLTLAARS